MAGYDLKSAILKIKAQPLNFGLYRGDDANQVLISQRPASAKQVAEIEEECGTVKRLVKGICFWEGTTLVFASKVTPAPAWEMLITKVFKENKCGSYLPVVLRQLGASESDEVAGEEGGNVAPAAPPAPAAPGTGVPPPAPPPPSDASAQFSARLKEIRPAIDRTLATPGPASDALKALLGEMSPLARAQQFPEAHAVLDRLGKLLVPAAPPAPPAAPAVPTDFMERLKALKPRIEQAIAGGSPAAAELKLRFSEVGSLGRARRFEEAGAVLAQMEKLLGTAATAPPPPPTAGAERAAGETAGFQGMVAYRKALLDFGAAKKEVAGQIAALRKAIPGVLPAQAELARKVGEHLDAYNEELGDLIDGAMNTAKDEREPFNDDIRAEIEDYLRDLASNPIIAHVDRNKFTTVTIAETLGAALRKIVRTMV